MATSGVCRQHSILSAGGACWVTLLCDMKGDHRLHVQVGQSDELPLVLWVVFRVVQKDVLGNDSAG